VSSGAFWVAISYRLAACFRLPESEVRVELKFIGDRSSILGTTITPWGKLCAKNDKNGPKIDRKSRCFCTFSVFAGQSSDSLQNRWPENALLDRKPCA